MKKIVWILILFCTVQVHAKENNNSAHGATFLSTPPPDVANDTLFFDLQNAIYSFSNGITYFDMPIYVKSKGPVSSFDFRMKFNQTKLTYISTTKIIAQLEPYSFLNPNDNFLRNNTSGPYVSYVIPNNTPLVYVRFQINVPCTSISETDFFSITTLLVGYPSKYKVTPVTPITNNSKLTTSILCSGSPIVFKGPLNASGIPIAEYAWDLGNGSTSKNQDVSTSYTEPGNYTAKLIVKTAEGCKDSITQVLKVNQSPKANFTSEFLPLKDSTKFTNISQNVGNSPTYEWNFGDQKTSTEKNPTHYYSAGGEYSVTLKVRTEEGCVSSYIFAIALAKPNANFIYSTNACVDAALNFINTSVNTIGTLTKWEWDFGDATTSSVENPSHVFKKPGTYQVKLNVTSSQGSKGTITKTIIINNKPKVDFMSNSISGCSPFPVSFIDQSITDEGSQYLWDFGDFKLSTEKDPTHTFVAVRSYTIKQIITTKGGCKDSLVKTSYITVLNIPAADFTNSMTCSNKSINFNDKSTVLASKVTSWFWEFGDGNTSNIQNPTHVFSKKGKYKLNLTATSSIGCSNTIEKEIVVSDKPIVQFSAENTSGCLPLTPKFNDFSNTAEGSTYTWIYGDSTSSTEKSPNHTYLKDGLFTVKEIITAPGGCKDSLVIPGYIYALSAVYPKFMVKNFCAKRITEFIDSSSVSKGSIKNWKWEINKDIIQAQNKSYIFDKPGKYLIKLTVSSDQNCENSIQKEIEIEEIPKVIFTSDKIEGCFPEVINFKNTSIASSNTKYAWDFGDGFKETTFSPFHKYQSMDTFTVKCFASTPLGCKDSLIKTKMITIQPVPTAKFAVKNTTSLVPNLKVVFENLSSKATEFYWEFGDNTSTALVSPQHAFIEEKAADYPVCLTAYSSKSCYNTYCDNIKINYSTVLAVPSAFSPNGDNNNDVFKILGGPISKLDLKIFNEWGNEIFSSTSQNDGWDGTYKGLPQPIGSYQYTFEATTVDGKEVTKNGIINLTR
jgi:gliding motility-associated-like protein